MNIASLIKVTILVTAMLSTPAFSKPGNAVSADVWEQRCMGWSSEISEIAGALHDATAESGTVVSEALYLLEDAAQERCLVGFKAEKLLARNIEQDIARATSEVERIIFTSAGSRSAEKVLAAALLKLVRAQVQVVAMTTAQG